MTALRKTRCDAKVEALPTEQFDALCAWLFRENVSFDVAKARLAEKFQVAISRNALSNWYQRECQARMIERIRSGRHISESIQADLKSAAPTVNDATLHLIGQKAFDLAVSESPNVKDLALLTKLLLETRQQDLDRRKLALLEEKANEAKAQLTELASKGGLSPETLQAIEAAAKIL
jgi:hypothetical protein